MATTLVQLQDQIRLDARIKNKTGYSDLRLTNDINNMSKQLQLKLRPLWRNESSVAATAGTLTALTVGDITGKAIAFSDITGLLKAPSAIFAIGTTDTSTLGIAYFVDRFEFQERANNSFGNNTLTDPCFTIQGEAVWIIPSTITTATVYYEKVITDLVAATPSGATEIPDEYVKQLVNMVIQKIVGMQEEQDKMIQETSARDQVVQQQDATVTQGDIQLQ